MNWYCFLIDLIKWKKIADALTDVIQADDTSVPAKLFLQTCGAHNVYWTDTLTKGFACAALSYPSQSFCIRLLKHFQFRNYPHNLRKGSYSIRLSRSFRSRKATRMQFLRAPLSHGNTAFQSQMTATDYLKSKHLALHEGTSLGTPWDRVVICTRKIALWHWQLKNKRFVPGETLIHSHQLSPKQTHTSLY